MAQPWSLGELSDVAREVCVRRRRALGSWIRAGGSSVARLGALLILPRVGGAESSSTKATSFPAKKLPRNFPWFASSINQSLAVQTTVRPVGGVFVKEHQNPWEWGMETLWVFVRLGMIKN